MGSCSTGRFGRLLDHLSALRPLHPAPACCSARRVSSAAHASQKLTKQYANWSNPFEVIAQPENTGAAGSSEPAG